MELAAVVTPKYPPPLAGGMVVQSIGLSSLGHIWMKPNAPPYFVTAVAVRSHMHIIGTNQDALKASTWHRQDSVDAQRSGSP